MSKTQQYKTVFNGDTAYITQLKRQKSRKVLLLRSTLILWQRAAKVIAPFWFLLFSCVHRVAVKHCFKLLFIKHILALCFKNDDASQYERPKIDLSQCQYLLTDVHKHWHAWLHSGPHTARKISSGVSASQICDITVHFDVTSFYVRWGGGSSIRLQYVALGK